MSAAKEPEAAEPADEELAASPEVATALHAVQKAMENLAGLLGVDSAAALDALKQAGHTASDNLSVAAGEARARGQETLDDLSAAVRRNPLAWLAAAAGLGLIIGLWRDAGGRK
jgi:hypothetical protein